MTKRLPAFVLCKKSEFLHPQFYLVGSLKAHLLLLLAPFLQKISVIGGLVLGDSVGASLGLSAVIVISVVCPEKINAKYGISIVIFII